MILEANENGKVSINTVISNLQWFKTLSVNTN